MDNFRTVVKKAFEYVLPWVVLAVLVAFTYAKFYARPYGFSWTRDGVISKVYVREPEPTIHVGDRLIKVGTLEYQTFKGDLRLNLFDGWRVGDSVPIAIEHGGQLQIVQWRMPGANEAMLQDNLLDPWLLGFFFWAAGLLAVVLLRPRDRRWLLLASFDFLTAIWLVLGNGPAEFQVWDGALLVRAIMWVCIPVYLHLHWVFPKPLGQLPRALTWGTYGLFLALAAAQWFQLIPPDWCFYAFLLAIIGSLVLLVVHSRLQTDIRRDLGLVLVAAFLAVTPMAALGIMGAVKGAMEHAVNLTELAFLILPFGYLYAAYRHQLGGLEIRLNRLISINSFLILLGAIVVPILVAADRLPNYSPDQWLIISMLSGALSAALSLWAYPVFETFVEKRLLGISVPSRELQQAYSAHITTSNSFAELTHLLDNEILPTLLVRQFAFLVMESGASRVVLIRGVDREQVPAENAGEIVQALAGRDLRATVQGTPYSWIRLALPLRTQDELVGMWLFGRRDPDDMYPRVEVPVLQSFANQTAVALSNIQHGERLRAMYQANINRHENERLSLARDLHDSVLSELAGMLMNADMQTLPKNFQDGYGELTRRLREIVNELRPPMLSYGLKPAIEELADNLMERTKDAIEIEVELASEGGRYPIDREQHLFRIVQEACENAVRHSGCRRINISGQLSPNAVDMMVQDDGSGFQMGKDDIQLYALLSERHFGLAGILERAELIQAQIRIISAPGEGTCISISWKGDPTAEADQSSAGSSI